MLYCWWLLSAVCKCHTPTDMRLQKSDIGHETSDMRHRTTDNGQWVWSQIVDKMFDSSFRVVVFVVCSWASSLFYVATELESLLLRTRQITVAVSVDDRSLQKRLFEFTGCWGRPVMMFHRKCWSSILSIISRQCKLLNCFLCRRKWLENALRKHSMLTSHGAILHLSDSYAFRHDGNVKQRRSSWKSIYHFVKMCNEIAYFTLTHRTVHLSG